MPRSHRGRRRRRAHPRPRPAPPPSRAAAAARRVPAVARLVTSVPGFPGAALPAPAAPPPARHRATPSEPPPARHRATPSEPPPARSAASPGTRTPAGHRAVHVARRRVRRRSAWTKSPPCSTRPPLRPVRFRRQEPPPPPGRRRKSIAHVPSLRRPERPPPLGRRRKSIAHVPPPGTPRCRDGAAAVPPAARPCAARRRSRCRRRPRRPRAPRDRESDRCPRGGTRRPLRVPAAPFPTCRSRTPDRCAKSGANSPLPARRETTGPPRRRRNPAGRTARRGPDGTRSGLSSDIQN